MITVNSAHKLHCIKHGNVERSFLELQEPGMCFLRCGWFTTQRGDLANESWNMAMFMEKDHHPPVDF